MSDVITRETTDRLTLLETEIAVFWGYRQLWAEGGANGRPLPLSLDVLEKEQRRQINKIAYAALCAQQSVFPGKSPHAYFRYQELTEEVFPTRPTVVCLCGSTRFYDAWQRANYEETMAGRIVLMVGFYPHSAGQAHGEDVGCTPEQKHALDELHLRKIDLADEVLILNVGGYVGESTRREIAYAQQHGKRVRWLEEPAL